MTNLIYISIHLLSVSIILIDAYITLTVHLKFDITYLSDFIPSS